jgi:hypothetical protein
MFRSLKQFRTLLSVASTLNTGINRDTAMRNIVSLTYMVVSAERVTLWLVDRDNSTVTVGQSHDGQFKQQIGPKLTASIQHGVSRSPPPPARYVLC